MNTSMQSGRDAASSWRRGLRPLLGTRAFCGWALLLLLGWGSAAPASAEGGEISTARTGPIFVLSGETLTIVDSGSVNGALNVFPGGTLKMTGGSVSGGSVGVSVSSGGTVTISGGSVSGGTGVRVVGSGSTATISGGSVTSGNWGVYVNGGTVAISGGSVSGSNFGVIVDGGTATIPGCNVAIVNGVLTGTLLDGTPINTGVAGPITLNTPRITTCPPAQSASAGPGCQAAVPDFTGEVVASDDCSTVTITQSPAAGTLVGLGVRTITLRATNAALRSSTCTTGFTVLDATPPVVTPPNNITQAAAPGQCSAQVSVGQATATDTCAGALTPVGTRSDREALTAPYPVGATTITWTARDPAGNQASASQTVTINDTEQPTITCPGNQTVQATSAGGALMPFTVGASDNCASVSTECKVGGVVITSPYTFPLGPTPVNCTATDAAGNIQTCSFTVTVVPVADLSVAYQTPPSTVVTGSNLTYTIAVQNSGPQAALGVVVTSPLPAGTSFVSAPGAVLPKKSDGNVVTWNLGTLAPTPPGQPLQLTLVVRASAKAGATISHTASVSSSSPQDPNPGNNSASVATLVAARR
jgi:uncharacterized repeat protein (TIGR01451 family)